MKFAIYHTTVDYEFGGALRTEHKIQVGEYDLDPMPGCAAIGISHGLRIDCQWRGKGIGTRAHQERLDKARELGYRVLICTIVNENKSQVAILRKYKWKIARSFWNLKTDHNVVLYYKDLYDAYEEFGGV